MGSLHARAIGTLVLAGALVGACTSATPPPRASATPLDGITRTLEPRIDATTGQGRVEDRQFRSAALDRVMPYRIYLPPRYDSEPARRYPVLYLLHGISASYRQWVDLGLAAEADRMIKTGQIAPLVVVMPEGESSYWVDQADGGPKWGAYVAVDLVREVEGGYRVMSGQRNRAIGGLSMGAHGALQLSLNYPGVFGSVGAHSLVLRRFGSAPAFFGDRDQYDQRDPVFLVREKTDVARSLALWVDIGYLDEWAALALDFENELNDLRVVHQWHLWPGGHTDEYWIEHLPEYLHFYDAALGGRAARS
jgi:S-formylglutathione hydrolase FrmB